MVPVHECLEARNKLKEWATMWDQCVDPDARPALEDRSLDVYIGIDASVRHDQTALVACYL